MAPGSRAPVATSLPVLSEPSDGRTHSLCPPARQARPCQACAFRRSGALFDGAAGPFRLGARSSERALRGHHPVRSRLGPTIAGSGKLFGAGPSPSLPWGQILVGGSPNPPLPDFITAPKRANFAPRLSPTLAHFLVTNSGPPCHRGILGHPRVRPGALGLLRRALMVLGRDGEMPCKEMKPQSQTKPEAELSSSRRLACPSGVSMRVARVNYKPTHKAQGIARRVLGSSWQKLQFIARLQLPGSPLMNLGVYDVQLTLRPTVCPTPRFLHLTNEDSEPGPRGKPLGPPGLARLAAMRVSEASGQRRQRARSDPVRVASSIA